MPAITTATAFTAQFYRQLILEPLFVESVALRALRPIEISTTSAYLPRVTSGFTSDSTVVRVISRVGFGVRSPGSVARIATSCSGEAEVCGEDVMSPLLSQRQLGAEEGDALHRGLVARRCSQPPPHDHLSSLVEALRGGPEVAHRELHPDSAHTASYRRLNPHSSEVLAGVLVKVRDHSEEDVLSRVMTRL